jgi:hypothetical protein
MVAEASSLMFIAMSLIGVAAGCSSDPKATTAPAASDSPTTTPPPTTSSTTSLAEETTAPSDNPLSLACSDSIGPGTPADPDDLTVAGITFSGIPAHGPAALGSNPIGSEADPYTFRKVFLYVAPTAADQTRIEVIAPDDGRIFYTDSDHWGVKFASRIVDNARKIATIPRCGDMTRGFLGGLVTHGSNCVTLQITTDAAAQTVRVPINSGEC